MKGFELLTESVAFALCMILSVLVLLGMAAVIVGALLIVALAILGG